MPNSLYFMLQRAARRGTPDPSTTERYLVVDPSDLDCNDIVITDDREADRIATAERKLAIGPVFIIYDSSDPSWDEHPVDAVRIDAQGAVFSMRQPDGTTLPEEYLRQDGYRTFVVVVPPR